MENKKELRVPYATSGVADAILDLFRRLNPPKIDNKFIVENNIATSNNAFSSTDFVKWMGITDNEGKVNQEVVNKLRLVGEEKNKFIKQLIEKSYGDLFHKVNVAEAKREDIINYFITYHRLGTGSAKYAAALFLHLCYKYNIPVAEELKKKTHTGKRKPNSVKNIQRKNYTKKDETYKKINDEDEEKIKEGLLLSVQTASTKFKKKFETLSEFEKFLDNEWEARVNSWKLDLLEYDKEADSPEGEENES